MPYNATVDPGGTPKVPAQATTWVLSQLRYGKGEAHIIHENYNNTEEELKNMLVEALDRTYIFSLHDVSMGYMGSSTKDTTNHLMTRYGRITEAGTEEKKKPLQ